MAPDPTIHVWAPESRAIRKSRSRKAQQEACDIEESPASPAPPIRRTQSEPSVEKAVHGGKAFGLYRQLSSLPEGGQVLKQLEREFDLLTSPSASTDNSSTFSSPTITGTTSLWLGEKGGFSPAGSPTVRLEDDFILNVLRRRSSPALAFPL